jgi:hypothetical protein
MFMSEVQTKPPDLAKRVFAKGGFAVVWVGCLAAVFGTVGVRLANAWLVKGSVNENVIFMTVLAIWLCAA